jgi:hypothetical protein
MAGGDADGQRGDGAERRPSGPAYGQIAPAEGTEVEPAGLAELGREIAAAGPQVG